MAKDVKAEKNRLDKEEELKQKRLKYIEEMKRKQQAEFDNRPAFLVRFSVSLQPPRATSLWLNKSVHSSFLHCT